MEDEARRGHTEGLVLVALMFIGAGVGLAFGRPDVGGAIGMGLGFLAMAFLRHYRVRAEGSIRVRGVFGSLILACTGALFVVSGLALLLNLAYLMRYAAGAAAVAIGLAFLAAALRVLRK